MRYLPGNGPQVIERVVEVHTLLEVIATPVRQDAVVHHMDFCNCPTIKSWLCKQVFKQRVVADLHVSGAQPHAFDQRFGRYGSAIAVMQDPHECCNTSLDAG